MAKMFDIGKAVPKVTIALICAWWAIPTCAVSWEYVLHSESARLSDNPLYLFATGDLNRNGIKEVVVADFGLFNEAREWQLKHGSKNIYNLLVLEWRKKKLEILWRKQWDRRKARNSIESSKYYSFSEAKRLLAWTINGRVIVETVPPYLGLEWENGEYQLREQYGPYNETPLLGSWAFPWLDAACYFGFANRITYPRECLVGIRDFSGKGETKIVTMVEEEAIKDKHYIKDKYKITLRVREFAGTFPIEWEMERRRGFYSYDPIDKFNWHLTAGLRLREWRSYDYYLFGPEEKGPGYQLTRIPVQEKIDVDSGPMGISASWYWDIHIGTTQRKGTEEYWGYHRIAGPDDGYIETLRKVTIKSDLSAFVRQDIKFTHHKPFLGVGYFDLHDLDGDGLDEVILVEQTGKRIFHEEWIEHRDVKDYVRILKWNGTRYQTMWLSPPYNKRGTRFLVADVKGVGKKQLVILSPDATVQIWEMK